MTLLSCLVPQWRWLEGWAHLRLSTAVLGALWVIRLQHGGIRFQEQVFPEQDGSCRTFMN